MATLAMLLQIQSKSESGPAVTILRIETVRAGTQCNYVNDEVVPLTLLAADNKNSGWIQGDVKMYVCKSFSYQDDIVNIIDS